MPTHSKYYYYDIVPLTRVALTRAPWFTYRSVELISEGSFVEVPLFRRTVRGVIWKKLPAGAKKPAFAIKDIRSVIAVEFLTREQRLLAEHISERYLVSLGLCLKHFLPKIVQARKPELLQDEYNESKKRSRLGREEKKLFKELSSDTKHTDFALEGVPIDVALQAAKKHAGRTGQVLVLVPEILAVDAVLKQAHLQWKTEQVTVLHSRLTDGQYFAGWEYVRSGEAHVIIGTRQALFAPFQSLTDIILTDECDDTYKQWDMSPRYDARQVVSFLTTLHDTQLLHVSPALSLETLVSIRNQHTRCLALPTKAQTIIPEVIDLKLDRWKKNFSPFSKRLAEILSITLARKEKAVLLVGHQGMSRFSICTRCKSVLRCPNCDRALILSKEGHYYCLHCSYKTDIFPTCLSCRGTEFRNMGIGTERVEREVTRMFPRVAKILRIDRQSRSKKATQGADTSWNVCIGTRAALYAARTEIVSLVAFIDTDSLFSVPDFRSDEQAFHLIQTATALLTHQSKVGTSGQLILQTFHSENPVIQACLQPGNTTMFTKKLLEERQSFGYPPYGRLIVLTFKDRNMKKVDSAAKKLYNMLLESKPSFEAVSSGKMRISLPQEASVSSVRGVVARSIVIRYSADTLPDALINFLKRLPTEWIIDIDPIKII